MSERNVLSLFIKVHEGLSKSGVVKFLTIIQFWFCFTLIINSHNLNNDSKFCRKVLGNKIDMTFCQIKGFASLRSPPGTI